MSRFLPSFLEGSFVILSEIMLQCHCCPSQQVLSTDADHLWSSIKILCVGVNIRSHRGRMETLNKGNPPAAS